MNLAAFRANVLSEPFVAYKILCVSLEAHKKFFGKSAQGFTASECKN
jgi:hypothetical protein